MRPVFAAAALAALSFGAAGADDSILVLDASGSMWGQIEGRAKIEIAREVMDGLIDSLPAEEKLGLVAYGHRRKGDCADIEVIAETGADRAALKKAVGALSPKGKTPLSASVRMAAEKLKYTEAKARVILVSDGAETCAADPCAEARALEAAGVDLTVHVVGFGLESEAERASLQCIAEETGGRFILAENAGELAKALEGAVAAPEPAPAKASRATLRATELSGGPVIEKGLSWRVTPAGGAEVFAKSEAGQETVELPPAVYDVEVVRASDGLRGKTRFELPPGADKTVTIPLELVFEATLTPDPPTSAPAGGEIAVTWTGPARKSDYITIVKPDAPPTGHLTYTYVDRGNPLKLRLPSEPGDYEIRYVLHAPTKVLAKAPYTAEGVGATLDAPETAIATTDVSVAFEGPRNTGDWITIVPPDHGETAYKDYAYAENGSPAKVRAPFEPGVYEVRYVMRGEKIIGRRPITILPAEASLEAPDEGRAGADIPVAWTGPGNNGDWLTIVKPDAEENRYIHYSYTDKGSPLKVHAPIEPGDYEVRYVARGDKVIARRPITITASEASLDAPEEAVAGTHIKVKWTGPGDQGDWITIIEADAEERRYRDYAYAKTGNPAEVRMPLEAGEYQIRYVARGQKVIASRPVRALPAEATLDAPAEAQAGDSVKISWTGPNAQGDWLTIVKADAAENRYTDYHYAKNGAPAALKVPTEAGEWEVRYTLSGQKVIARTPLRVTMPSASVSAPDRAPAGAKIKVAFEGPGFQHDWVTVTKPDAAENRFTDYFYPRNGSPGEVTLPKEPGAYEVRYVLGGNKVIARRPITLE